MATVETERRGPVLLLTLNRPQVRNAVDADTAVAITRAVEDFADDNDARALVVTGAGDVAFCAGADLKGAAGLLAHDAVDRAGPMGFARLDPGKPVIAAINGFCLAGGMELAAWCDFRISEEHAEFGVVNRRWGVPLIDGGTQRLPRIVGLGNALYLIETGAQITARQAKAMGFVQEIVPTGQSVQRAVELGERIAEYPRQSLAHDRSEALGAFERALTAGIQAERESGVPTLSDPELAAALERFLRGERPEPPRPPNDPA
ncbi:MAG TPA: enoyl-CoA hydratase-related protein [Actinomycetota bacterium]|nr:enoyl-CoA hydratase-related protein [Actinomycetota bacterium]